MTKRIAVVGGGIGGLSAALSLLQRGFDVQIYERAPQLLELGAGLQLGSNAVHVLRSLGVGERLSRIGSHTPRIVLRRWKDGSEIVSRRNDNAEELYGAPQCWVHRGELSNLLLEAIPSDRVHTDHKCVSIEQGSEKVLLRFANGREALADLVVGADGIHSMVREVIVGPDKPRFSGICAYRGLVPIERFQRLGETDLAAVWIGPGGHVVHYPISAGTLVNVVGMVNETSWTRESWYDQGSKEEYCAYFKSWHPRLQAILGEVDESQLMKWALYDRPALPYWSKGKIVLLGDAAHAMLPFMGQGAAQAIEDGVILARCLAAFPADIALTTYEKVRQPRATRIQEASRLNGDIFHLEDGEAQQARDARMKLAEVTRDPVFAYNAVTAPLEILSEANA